MDRVMQELKLHLYHIQIICLFVCHPKCKHQENGSENHPEIINCKINILEEHKVISPNTC